MWNMAGAGESNDRCVGQGVGDLCDHRGERWRASVPRCKERRTIECPDPCEVEAKLLRIAGLVQEGRCIRDERLLQVVRELRPRTRPERYRLDELLGSACMVTGRNALDHGTDPLADF